MTVAEIDAFLAIVHYGSMTAAAQKLFISQPALSRRIRALEEELGFPLLLRSKGIRFISLTDQGRNFILIAEKWRRLWDEMQGASLNASSPVLHVSSIGSLLSYVLFPAMQQFLSENPTCDFSMETQHSIHAYDFVSEGKIDIALVSDLFFSKSVNAIPLWREPMYLVAGEKVEILQGMPPSALNVSQEIKVPWHNTFETWHNYWFGRGVRPHIVLDQMTAIENFICAPSLWMIAPASVARVLTKGYNLRTAQLSAPPPDRYIYCLTRKNWKSDVAERFILHIKGIVIDNSDIFLFTQ